MGAGGEIPASRWVPTPTRWAGDSVLPPPSAPPTELASRGARQGGSRASGDLGEKQNLPRPPGASLPFPPPGGVHPAEGLAAAGSWGSGLPCSSRPFLSPVPLPDMLWSPLPSKGQTVRQKPPNTWILLLRVRPELCPGDPGLPWFTGWALVRRAPPTLRP